MSVCSDLHSSFTEILAEGVAAISTQVAFDLNRPEASKDAAPAFITKPLLVHLKGNRDLTSRRGFNSHLAEEKHIFQCPQWVKIQLTR